MGLHGTSKLFVDHQKYILEGLTSGNLKSVKFSSRSHDLGFDGTGKNTLLQMSDGPQLWDCRGPPE